MDHRRAEESAADYEEIRRDCWLGEQPQTHTQAREVFSLCQ
jgi:hypothetical protein